MDEPTNDLDVETLELLEEQLMNYTGTLLLVSHDRSFLDNVVTSTLVLEGDGSVAQYPGGYADWLQQRPVKKAGSGKKRGVRQGLGVKKAQYRLSYKEKQERKELPHKIDALETEIAQLQEIMAEPTIYQKDPEKAEKTSNRLPRAEAELEKVFERWSAIEARAEQIGE
jgi:ATP-binding cassette subfamily F protein uup